MQVSAFPILKDNYVFIIKNSKNQVILFDPGEAAGLIDYLTEAYLTPVAVFITHHHADHTGGVPALVSRYHPLVVQNPNRFVKQQGIDIPGFPHFTVMDVPGHTLDHIAYYTPDYLFCGDTLFSAGCGRLFEGSAGMLYASLQQIARLPDNTKIYCTHEYTLKNLAFAAMIEPDNVDIQRAIQEVRVLRANNEPSLPTTLSKEKAINPFLRCHVPVVIHRASQYANRDLKSHEAVFETLRRLKDSF